MTEKEIRRENMAKRAISLLLVGLMLILTLTGCGTNELGYLKLSKEIGSITQYEFSNSTQLEVSGISNEDYNIDLSMKGTANIENINSMYLNMDVMFKVNDMENELPINFIMDDNKLYVSKNAILEIIKLEEKYDGTQEDTKVIDKLYNVELKDTEYILIYDMSEDYSAEDGASYRDMYDSAMDYLTSAFKGFDSKLITKTNNGYAMELTSESAVAFMERLIKYVSENKALVFDETVKYFENIYDDMNIQELEGMTEDDKDAFISELKEGRQEFYDFVDKAVLFMESEEFKTYENMLDGCKLKDEIYKKGNSYVQNIQGELAVKDMIKGSLNTSTEITPAHVEKSSSVSKSITIDDLESMYNVIQDEINPVKKIELNWYPEGSDAYVSRYRLDGKTDLDVQPYMIIEGRLYLPLRYIGESFGEEVQWDNEAKKAYVVSGSEKIDMTGVLVDDTTMVKIRDFEKLGYKVDFVQDDELSMATIEK